MEGSIPDCRLVGTEEEEGARHTLACLHIRPGKSFCDTVSTWPVPEAASGPANVVWCGVDPCDGDGALTKMPLKQKMLPKPNRPENTIGTGILRQPWVVERALIEGSSLHTYPVDPACTHCYQQNHPTQWT